MNCEEIVEIIEVFFFKKTKQYLKRSKAAVDFSSDVDRKIRRIYIYISIYLYIYIYIFINNIYYIL